MTPTPTRADSSECMKWGRYSLLALLVVSTPAYRWLPVDRHVATPPRYAIDIAAVRRLADSRAGAKPRLIREETVAHLSAPGAIVFDGGGSQPVDLPVSSYELVFPDHLAIVDAALNADLARSMTAPTFD